MRTKISREKAQRIRDDLLDNLPRAKIRRRYSISKALLSRIESGTWFREQSAREAKARKKLPKGFGWCGACGTIVKKPCKACKDRLAVATRHPSYRRESRLHAVMQPDGTCKITREPAPLAFALLREHEEARQEVRAGLLGG